MVGSGGGRHPRGDTVLTLDLGVGTGCRQHCKGPRARVGCPGWWRAVGDAGPWVARRRTGRSGPTWPSECRGWRLGGGTREMGWCMDRAWSSQ